MIRSLWFLAGFLLGVVVTALARALGMPIYRYVAEEIRLMPADMLPVYDALAEER